MTTRTEGDAPMSEAAPKQKTRSEMIREIRTSEATYFFRNNTNNRLSCSTEKQYLSLGPAGRGEDVAILPKELLDQPGFQRLWAAGKVTISDDPAMEEEMIQASARNDELRDQAQRDLQNIIEEPSSNRDLLERECLISGERVYQTYSDIKNMVPPLAPEHKSRAHEFTPHVSQDEKGNEVVTFSRVTIEK